MMLCGLRPQKNKFFESVFGNTGHAITNYSYAAVAAANTIAAADVTADDGTVAAAADVIANDGIVAA